MGSASKSYQYNLGRYHRKVTTANAQAQVWFDRGLIWSYAFHHEESARCFERAIAEDPGCAMAYWGVSSNSQQSGVIQGLTLAACLCSRPKLQQAMGSLR